MITLVVLLFLINVFSGVDHVWFHWPAVPLLLIAILWAAIQRKPS
jgi:adenylate cyclase